ncbi:SDR family oxidoreductase [Iamia sp.]|uniref:SDR family NAD(P)-dependent oxidoreductase n=1 Tax=Iamia sp. TaxID=2722710 RepID=UPI002B5FC555|nr:SDR family oxidoreductase [Iamia sp.]HXH58486.1 SDR family oxidoreductase [Iamia sp.]
MGERLLGHTVLVVGAGSMPSPEPDAPVGNGRAISVACAREGARVVCADRDETSARVTASLVRDVGGEATVVVADVSDEDGCAEMVAAARDLTGVVCNAGIGRGAGGLIGTSADDWDATLAVNLRGPFLIARLAMPLLTVGGSFVFIGSLAGLQPGSRLPAYDASKAGLIGLSRHVALEGARQGVRSNVVAPGLIDTPLGRAATRGRPTRGRTLVPLGRQGTAWEVAAVTVFLLSDEASYITGTTLSVDGGLGLI